MDSAPESASSQVKDEVVQVVEQGAEVAVQVAGKAAEQASQVGSEASSVANRLVGDAKAQMRDGAEAQLSELADGMHVLSRHTRALAQGRPNEAGSLIDYVQEGADWLGDVADHLQEGGLDGVAIDLKRFARSRPVVFLAGSALTGLAVGRLLRNEAVAVQRRLAEKQLHAGEKDRQLQAGETAGGSDEPGADSAPGSHTESAAPVGNAGR
jgi:hypothetical protein